MPCLLQSPRAFAAFRRCFLSHLSSPARRWPPRRRAASSAYTCFTAARRRFPTSPRGLADKPDGMQGNRGMVMKRKQTLAAQLAELGVAPTDVKVLAFSHTHSDHVGNANMFIAATLYMQQAEYDAAFGSEPSKFGFVAANYDKLRASPAVKLNGDHDVFGDGSVTILSTPGHTPGHQSLLLRLPKTGPVVLSGDFVHFRENWENRRVPARNFNKEQSLASMEKLAAILEREHATLSINHDKPHTDTLPHAPGFAE